MHKVIHKHRAGNHIDLSHDLQKLKSILASTTLNAKNKAGHLINQSLKDMKEKSFAMRDDVADYVIEKPFTTIGFSVLAGIFLGYFLHK